MNLQETFAAKINENGDISFNKVSNNNLLNVLFMTEYYQKHLNEVSIGTSDKEKLFSMFIRDPRYGLGRRDLGRVLMSQSKVSLDNIVKAGRWDDIFYIEYPSKEEFNTTLDWVKIEIEKGNELLKKWMPRYSSKHLLLAREIAKYWGINKQQYGHFIKCNTTEHKLSQHNTGDIEFEHVPSLAMIKYAKRFATGADTKERYAQYLNDVKAGKKDLKVSTTTVYDIYKNRQSIDADLFFSKIEKIKGSWIPIVDTSGSMVNANDSFGKALSIGHYLAKCSSYAPNQVISFSSTPQLITLGTPAITSYSYYKPKVSNTNSQYQKEINSMYTGDCSNTDFGAVMDLLKNLTDMPEYLVVLSDMEFDIGSRQSKLELQQLWKQRGYTTKIVWWNLNARNTTAPEMDNMGNIFLSGYNPMLLKYLQAGFNGEKFLNELLIEYKKKIEM